MSCRWHGSSCIQCHFLRSCGWQSLPKWHCNSQSTVARCWGCVCCRSWALLQWKSSFARVPGCSAHGPAGACSKSRSNSCISLVGHHHLHITSGGWSLSQYCLLSVCPSLIMSKHWNCDSSVLSAFPSFPRGKHKNCLHMHRAIIAGVCCSCWAAVVTL